MDKSKIFAKNFSEILYIVSSFYIPLTRVREKVDTIYEKPEKFLAKILATSEGDKWKHGSPYKTFRVTRSVRKVGFAMTSSIASLQSYKTKLA